MYKFILFLFNFFLIFLLSDQILLFYRGNISNHIFACHLKPCEASPFLANKEHSFLIDREKSHFLNRLKKEKTAVSNSKYLLNESGFRIENKAFPPRKTIVNVFGDSFTFGLFLEEEETFTSILNRKSKRCYFRNYGVPAFSFHQMLTLSNDRKLVEDADIDLYIIITDDISRMTRPFEVHFLGRDFLLSDLIEKYPLGKNFFYFKIPNFLIGHSYFFQTLYGYFDDKFWHESNEGHIFAIISDHFRLLRRENKLKLYAHFPVEKDYKKNEFGEYILRLPEELEAISFGTPKLASLPEFQKKFFSGDGHPNALGNIWAAERLQKKLHKICF